MRRLINDTSVTFYRPPEEELDEYGDIVPPDPENVSEVPTRGSLQPYQRGDESVVLPEGRETEDARTYVTKVDLKASSSDVSPDYCILEGRKFIVFDRANASTTNVLRRVRNFQYVLLRDDSEEAQGAV